MISSDRITGSQVLLLDTHQVARHKLSADLRDEMFVCREAVSPEEALKILAAKPVAVVVIILRPDMPPSAEMIAQVHTCSPDTEIIIVTSSHSEEEVSRTAAAGVFDCLLAPVSTAHLLTRIQKAAEYSALKAERNALKEQVAMRFAIDSIIGVSAEITRARETVQRVAPTDIPVLITGAPGTGKSLIAAILHHHSRRRGGRMVTLDQATLPTGTGARPIHRLLAEAAAGTLLIDGAEQLTAATQTELLQVLKNCAYVDSDGRPCELDSRFITTAETDLTESVQAGRFRRELLDRLGVLRLELPPLRSRPGDVEVLVEYYLRRYAGEAGRSGLSLSKPAINCLMKHPWPGNVRELKNTLRRAVALGAGDTIERDNIVFIDDGTSTPPADTANSQNSSVTRLDDSQRTLIIKALNENRWNFTQTAQELGIGRTTLWRKVKKYNLKRQRVKV